MRPITELVAIGKELKAVYDGAYQTAASDGKITVKEATGLTRGVLAILIVHKVTLEELAQVLELVEAFLPLLPEPTP